MQVFVGTSGWMYKDWAERFYPKHVKDSDKLAYFAETFPTVEVNSTFYHVPLESTTKHWHDIVPKGFLFAIKLNRYLTHTKHLLPDEDFDAALKDFYRRIQPLGKKLSVILVQLPPSMKLDVSRIEHLAAITQSCEKALKMRLPLAIEFRHGSWFTSETFAALRKLDIANVVIDSPGRWPASKEVTGTIGYVRFHGSKRLYRSSYTDKELAEWAAFIQERCAGCDRVFAYFNNDHAAAAVDNAKTLGDLLTADTI